MAKKVQKVVKKEKVVKPVVEAKVDAAPVVKEEAPKKAVEKKAAPKKAVEKKIVKEEPVKETVEVKEETKPVEVDPLLQKRRSIAFVGSECFPFVKTGGLGDVMYALPRELVNQNCDVKVILPKYACIKQEWKDKMEYKGSFYMDLCSDGRQFYVGIMEIVFDNVTYDFIDNEEFFSNGNPYTSIVDDIPKYCYFSKAALAALNYLNWIPDIIHCHDWQAGLVPVFQKTLFATSDVGRAKTMFTIHNLRFQGIYNYETFKYWTNLPDYVLRNGAIKVFDNDVNMLKGGISYADMVTTVSNTYAGEIQTDYYGEGLDGHLRYHSNKLRGIVNGIDVEGWNPDTDKLIAKNYNATNAIANKKINKMDLQKEVGLDVDDHKMVIGLVSRLTNQKGLDLINAIIEDIIDDHTQIVVLGSGDANYENSFRYYEDTNKGKVSASIMYDEARSHKIYAGADAFLVPSQFEPCGLTQLIAMRYGSVPIVRETGGLKDTVEPYNEFENTGNGYTFDRYEARLLLDAINRAKTTYFEYRDNWDKIVIRDMEKDVSWTKSARAYKQLYLDLTWYYE